jgi:SET domain-containing protein
MYVVSVEVSKSNIDGKGVFALEDIPAGKIVWLYNAGHEIKMTQQEYKLIPRSLKITLKNSGYLSPWSGFWVLPPENDPARFTNHSPKNNLSVVYDKSLSPEPYFIANRNIKIGEGLTNNYHEFDRITQETKPSWAK